MKGRIDDKIEEVKGYVSDLGSYVPSSFEEYIKDHKTKDACERCFEKIIEALVDLAFLVINENGFEKAQDDIGALKVLSRENVISEELAERLSDAKRMRNIIAHEYGTIDNSLVFEAITEDLGRDAREFLEGLGGVK